MGENLTIRSLIDRITSGDIRIPAFQRDYIWESDQVAFLLDSIYKKFPIGTIILWKTDNRLSTEKDLGSFTLPEPRKDYPVNYILDGQQRITSLFSVFQVDLKPNDNTWVNIYYDMVAEENVQESMFIPLNEEEVDLERYFPVNVLYDSTAYRKATEKIPENLLGKVDKLFERFKEFLIPNEIFESDDRNSVAIVFERINRAGTELDIFQLLSAWSWSEDFDLTDKFTNLQSLIIEHEFDDLCKDKDLQLRICAGIIIGRTSPSAILEMQGDQIREKFEDIERGIIGAIDFLKRELNVKAYKLLPFPGLLVPLASFFSTSKSEGFASSDKQKDILKKWFWISCISRRYSAGVNDKQAFDIKEMAKLKGDECYSFSFPKVEYKFDFIRSNFSVGNANSKTFILLLSQFTPYSFISGAKIDITKVLQKINKNEFHHIYPKAFLESKGHKMKDINVLANICFLTRGDNNKIKNSDPKLYVKMIPADKKKLYLNNALCPTDFGDLDYNDFLEARNKIILKKIDELINL